VKCANTFFASLYIKFEALIIISLTAGNGLSIQLTICSITILIGTCLTASIYIDVIRVATHIDAICFQNTDLARNILRLDTLYFKYKSVNDKGRTNRSQSLPKQRFS
jgi:hypothetical protein